MIKTAKGQERIREEVRHTTQPGRIRRHGRQTRGVMLNLTIAKQAGRGKARGAPETLISLCWDI